MKLTIRSNIISELKQLLSQEYTQKWRFRFGKMERQGFTPFLSRWDYQCVKESLQRKYSASRKRVGKRIQSEICDIGFVTDRRIILSNMKEEEGEKMAVTAYHIGTYDLILFRSQHEYQVEIEMTQKPLNLKELFEPVKFLYGLFKERVVECETKDDVIVNYNLLFDRDQETPWIVPQGLRYLNEKHLSNLRDYVVMPMRKSEKYMLFLCESGSHLVSKKNIWTIPGNIPFSLHDTVVMGEWHQNIFTGYDIAMIGGKDVRKKSLLQRLKKLRIVSVRFPFCEVVKCFRGNLGDHTHELLKKNEGVIFAPIRANYMNDRVFLYQQVENVGIKFNLVTRSERGYTMYTLKVGQSDALFTGTDKYPYESHIPLSSEDRDFIGPLNNTVFEFRWESNGFMPYMRAYEARVTSIKFAKKVWEYINNPLDKQLVINSLRTFKKKTFYSKEKISNGKTT